MNGIPTSVKDQAPILHRSTTEISYIVDEVEPCRTPVSSSRHARIVRRLGTPQLLFVLVAMMIAVAGLARALRQEPRVSAPSTTRGPAPKVFGSPYVRALAALVLLTFMTLTVGDYQFKAIARATYREDALAQFFSLFYAATGIVSFLFQVFLTPRILGASGSGTGWRSCPCCSARRARRSSACRPSRWRPS